MYRNRIWAWICVAFIWVFAFSVKNLDVKSMIIENKKINIMCDADAAIKSAISGEIKGMYANIIPTKDNADFIITDLAETDAETKYPEFEKTGDYIYSPIVAYYPVDFSPQNIFYQLNGSAYFMDMKELADAVLNDKTYKDFYENADRSYANNKITLCLPSKNSLYYDKTIEAIYIGLNNNRIPTDEERATLKPTVDALIEKSKTCNDIASETKDCQFGTIEILIGPEYIMNNYGDFGMAANYWDFNVAYFEKSNVFKYDIYVKRTDDTERAEELQQLISTMVIENDRFSNKTKYRTSYQNDYSKVFPSVNVLKQINFTE